MTSVKNWFSSFGKKNSESQSRNNEERKVPEQPNKSSKFSAKGLEDYFMQAMPKIQNAEGKDIVLFLGATGSGKSTTINYLLGAEFKQIITSDLNDTKAEKPKKLYDISDSDDDDEEGPDMQKKLLYTKSVFDVVQGGMSTKTAKIGHTLESQTAIPQCFNTSGTFGETIHLCDCPGFFDSRSETIEVGIALSTRLIIEYAKSVKAIVFVLNFSDMTGGRANLFKQIVEALENLLVNPLKFGANVHFVFTKPPSAVHTKATYLDVIQNLYTLKMNSKNPKDGPIIGITEQVLKNAKYNTFLIDPNELLKSNLKDRKTMKKMLKIFSRSEEIPNKQFKFPGSHSLLKHIGMMFHQQIQQPLRHLKITEQNPKSIQTSKSNIKTYEKNMIQFDKEIKTSDDNIKKYEKQINEETSKNESKKNTSVQSLKEKIEKRRKEAEEDFNNKINNLNSEINNIDEEIQNTNTSIEGIRSEINRLRSEQNELNTSQDIEIDTQRYSEQETYGSVQIGVIHTHDFHFSTCYKISSIKRWKCRENESSDKGGWSNESGGSGYTTYKATYSTPSAYYGSSNVTVYTTKRDYNASRITEIGNSISSKESQIQSYNTRIKDLQDRINNKKGSIEYSSNILEDNKKQIDTNWEQEENNLKVQIQQELKRIIQEKKDFIRKEKENIKTIKQQKKQENDKLKQTHLSIKKEEQELKTAHEELKKKDVMLNIIVRSKDCCGLKHGDLDEFAKRYKDYLSKKTIQRLRQN